jgi:hypothetical protein
MRGLDLALHPFLKPLRTAMDDLVKPSQPGIDWFPPPDYAAGEGDGEDEEPLMMSR